MRENRVEYSSHECETDKGAKEKKCRTVGQMEKNSSLSPINESIESTKCKGESRQKKKERERVRE